MASLRLVIMSSIMCLPMVYSQAKPDGQCQIPKVSKVVFSFSNFPSEDGQRKSQVGLQHQGGSVSGNKTVPWTLDVEQTTTTQCDGEDTIHVIANITSGKATPPAKKPPPAGYEYFPNMGWYKFHTLGASWSEARQKCADEGAHLVIVNSEAEADVMKQLFAKTSKSVMTAARKDAMWVGVVEKPPGSRTYVTIFDVPLASTGFSRWSPGDPNDTNGCVWLFEGNMGLADVTPCSTQHAYVCEVDL